MSHKNILGALLVVLLIAAGTTLGADEKTKIAAPSVMKGDPPPGNARTLAVSQGGPEGRR